MQEVVDEAKSEVVEELVDPVAEQDVATAGEEFSESVETAVENAEVVNETSGDLVDATV